MWTMERPTQAERWYWFRERKVVDMVYVYEANDGLRAQLTTGELVPLSSLTGEWQAVLGPVE